MSLVDIFWVVWEKMMQTHKAPDFSGLQRNMNCAFHLTFYWQMFPLYRNHSAIYNDKVLKKTPVEYCEFWKCRSPKITLFHKCFFSQHFAIINYKDGFYVLGTLAGKRSVFENYIIGNKNGNKPSCSVKNILRKVF